jgi:hypothetical protein
MGVPRTREFFLSDITRKSGRRADPGDHRRTLRGVFLWISLLMFGFAGRCPAEAADIQNRPVTSPGPGLPFAIADFDGDLRPDLARIQAGANVSGNTNYWIQLQLTSAGRQSIQLIAPAGGLVIEARDVNGDHAVDLVLTTAWLRQPVAIFLNDGHGSFSRAEPTAFPGALSASQTNWLSGSNLLADTVGIPQSGAGICPEDQDSRRDRSLAGLIPASRAGFPVSPSLVSQPGRAPPSEVPFL